MKIGINGFGRIGRNVLKALFERNEKNIDTDIEISWINDITEVKTCLHLLKYDSVFKTFEQEIKIDSDFFTIGNKKIKFFNSLDNASNNQIDILLDCSGSFSVNNYTNFKKVLVSAPFKESDITVVFGVNHLDITSNHKIISNASCTTNCLAPIAKCIDDAFGIEMGHMTTIHSYTNDQRLIDSNHLDLRRARAAALSMIPSTTGAASAVGEVIPKLKGKLSGTSIRVPTPNVSAVDVTLVLETEVDVKKVNDLLENASKNEMKNIIAVEKKPLVSCDFLKNSNSCIVDLLETKVTNKKLCRILAWYDNEWGFSNRMIDVTKVIKSFI